MIVCVIVTNVVGVDGVVIVVVVGGGGGGGVVRVVGVVCVYVVDVVVLVGVAFTKLLLFTGSLL